MPWYLGIAGVSGLILGVGGSPAYLAAPGAIIGGAVAAAVAHVAIGAGYHPSRIIAFARSLAIVCAAFMVAWVNVFRGRRIDVWHRAEWDAKAAARRD